MVTHNLSLKCTAVLNFNIPSWRTAAILKMENCNILWWRVTGGSALRSPCTGVDKGGQPPPPNRRAKIFLVKIEGLSSLPPAKSGRACYDNPTGRRHFYQMPNMYTCIAYLIEIRKFCSKNLVHKGVNFEAQNGQNALKLTYEHL